MATKTKTTKSAPKSAKSQRKAPNRTTGKVRTSMTTKVVNMRDKQHQSWAEIGAALDIAPRTARRLYDEKKGAGAHHGLLPGKGGRTVAQPKPKAKRTAKR